MWKKLSMQLLCVFLILMPFTITSSHISFYITHFFAIWLLTMVWRHVGSVVGRRKSILGWNCLRFTPPWTSCTTCTTIRVWPFSILFTVCSHWAAMWSTKTYTTTTAVDFLMLVAVTMSVMPWGWLVTAVMATWAWCCSHRNRKCLLAWDARDLYKSMQPCVMFSLIFSFLIF